MCMSVFKFNGLLNAFIYIVLHACFAELYICRHLYSHRQAIQFSELYRFVCIFSQSHFAPQMLFTHFYMREMNIFIVETM